MHTHMHTAEGTILEHRAIALENMPQRQKPQKPGLTGFLFIFSLGIQLEEAVWEKLDLVGGVDYSNSRKWPLG